MQAARLETWTDALASPLVKSVPETQVGPITPQGRPAWSMGATFQEGYPSPKIVLPARKAYLRGSPTGLQVDEGQGTTELVAAQLDQEGEPVRRIDALRWRAIVWAAHRQAAKMDGGITPVDRIVSRFGPVEAGLFWLHPALMDGSLHTERRAQWAS